MREPDEVAVVRGVMEVLNQEGPDRLTARYEDFFADDFEWRPALMGSVEGERVFVGKKQFASYWREFTAAFGEPTVTNSFEVIGSGRVLVTGRIQVSGVGSGVPIDNEVAYLFEIEDGRITSARSFMSRASAEEFLARA